MTTDTGTGGAPSAPPPPTDGASSGGTNDGDASATAYSTTNVQVVGVDEADFIKNDGSHIYILADGHLQIIEAWPAEESRRIASIEIEGTAKQLFVHRDRALVYSSLELLETGFDPTNTPPSPEKECTLGYLCDFAGDGRQLVIWDWSLTRLAGVLRRSRVACSR